MTQKQKYNKAQRLADALEMRGGVSYEVQSEAAALLRRQDELLKQALSSLKELVPDPQIDFGPAYEGTKQRQKQVIAAIRAHREAK